MVKTDLYNSNGKVTGTVELPKALFGLEARSHHLWRGVTTYLSRQRLGTVSTKRKGEVSGGGKKPFRQKGTGNARQGSIRAVQFVGGGIAHGPKNRDYSLELPKKMRHQALAESLSDKVKQGKFVVVENLSFETPKTKNATGFLKDFGVIGNKCLIVLERCYPETMKCFRNLPKVKALPLENLNIYDVANHEVVIFTKSALDRHISLRMPEVLEHKGNEK